MNNIKDISPVSRLCIIYNKQGLKHREVAERINKELLTKLNSENVRDRLRKLKKKFGSLESIQVKEQVNEFEKTLIEGGFEDETWSSGWFNGIYLKNKDGVMSYDDVRDELVVEMKKYSPKYPKIKRTKIKEGNLLIIDPADVHIGKLAMAEQTGDTYNIEIAKERCLEGVRGIVSKASGFPIEKIALIIGNDIIHVDNTNGSTTKGTPQDTDGMWWTMYQEAKNLYIKIVEELVTVADVHVIYNPSNHDLKSGFMLADSLSSWFDKAENVTFDVSINHRKYFKYGKNLICTSHGDGAKEADMPLIMAQEQKQMWADTDYRYIYLHHLHHKKQIKWQSGKDYQGATVESLRSPSALDSWHHRNGYIGAPKAVEGFIHNKEQGQISRIVHYF